MSRAKERALARAGDRAEAKRYGIALMLLVLAIVATAFVDHGAWAKLLVLAFEGVALLFLVDTADAGPRVVLVARIVVGLGLAGVAIAAISGGSGPDAGKSAFASVGLLLAIVAPVVVVRDLRREQEVNLQVAMGVLVVYLLLGMFFVFVYQLVERFSPPFFAQVSGTPDPVDFTYFSYVTLATIGYGDLTARSDLGRMLAVSEGLVGQLYLVSVVALVISGLGRSGSLRVERGLEPDEPALRDDEASPPSG
jgi:hypothetical protein